MAMVQFRASPLPVPPNEYDREYMLQLIRVLELYISKLDSNAALFNQSYKGDTFYGGEFIGDFTGVTVTADHFIGGDYVLSDGTAAAPSLKFDAGGTQTGLYASTTNPPNDYYVGVASRGLTGVEIGGYEDSGQHGEVVVYGNSNTTYGGDLLFLGSRNTKASPQILVSGDMIGDIEWAGYDGVAYQYTAMISATIDGTPSAGDMPTSLLLYTTPAGTVSPVIRMKIDQAGNVGIGTGTGAINAPLHIKSQSDGYTNIYIDSSGSSVYPLEGELTFGGAGYANYLYCYGNTLYLGAGYGYSNGTLIFDTNSTERMRIDSSGNVGIGNTPSYKLDVSGVINNNTGVVFHRRTNTGSSNNGLILGTTAKATAGSGGEGSLQIFSDDATNQLQGVVELKTSATASERRLVIQAIEQGIAYRNVTLAEAGGNVGIGTSSPTAVLNIKATGSSGEQGIVVQDSFTNLTSKGAVAIAGARYTNADTPFMGYGIWDSGTARELYLGGGGWSMPDANHITFYTAPTYTETIDTGVARMTIDSSGNVGIGTSSPTAVLNIKGTGTNNYRGIQVQDNFTNLTDKGASAIVGSRYTIANAPFTGYATWDTGTARELYLGGGGWDMPDATDISFYTAPTYNETIDTGVLRMKISNAGIVTMGAYGAGTATFSAAGVISSVSDETWKIKDGVPDDPDLMLKKLEPGYWFYNAEKSEVFGKERQLGFYAQNVNEAIGVEAAPIPEEGKSWGYYDRSVLAVTVLSLQKALETIAALQTQIDELKALKA